MTAAAPSASMGAQPQWLASATPLLSPVATPGKDQLGTREGPVPRRVFRISRVALCRATVALGVSAAWKPLHGGPGRSCGRERLKAGLVLEGFDDLFGTADRADEQEGEQLYDRVVTTRGVMHVLAGGALGASGARPAPLPDGHVRRDRAF